MRTDPVLGLVLAVLCAPSDLLLPGGSWVSPVVPGERERSWPGRGQVSLASGTCRAAQRPVVVFGLNAGPAICLAVRMCLLPRNGTVVWGASPSPHSIACFPSS